MNKKRLRKIINPANWKGSCVIFMFLSFSLFQTGQLYAKETSLQQNKREVTGTVIEVNGDPLPGTTITLDGTTSGVITDENGAFKIEVNDKDALIVSFIGMETQRIAVEGKNSFTIVVQEAASELDELTFVAFSKQKKESVIGSISAVRPSELEIPISNLTTALGGRITGIVSYQNRLSLGHSFRVNIKHFIYINTPLRPKIWAFIPRNNLC